MTNVKQNAIIFGRRVDWVEYRGQKQAGWNSTDPLILGNVDYVKKLDPDIPTEGRSRPLRPAATTSYVIRRVQCIFSLAPIIG